MAAVELMRETVRRIVEQEEARKGLVILQSVAFVLPSLDLYFVWNYCESVMGEYLNLLSFSLKLSLLHSRASYGQLVAEGKDEVAPPEVVDVTIPLQCLVKDSKLILQEASKVS